FRRSDGELPGLGRGGAGRSRRVPMDRPLPSGRHERAHHHSPAPAGVRALLRRPRVQSGSYLLNQRPRDRHHRPLHVPPDHGTSAAETGRADAGGSGLVTSGAGRYNGRPSTGGEVMMIRKLIIAAVLIPAVWFGSAVMHFPRVFQVMLMIYILLGLGVFLF